MARVVVIGAGHNGLVAGCRLARSGHQVTVLEQRETAGGSAAGEEFHPGFRHAGVIHDAATFSPAVAADLGLALKRTPAAEVRYATPEGLRTADELDPAGWASLQAALVPVRAFASSILASAPPRTDAEAPLLPLAKTAFGFRRLGNATMMGLLRTGPMAVDDFLAEHVRDPILRGGLALDGLHGTWMGPRSPTSTATWLLMQVLRDQDVQGGPAAVVGALVAALDKAGGRLRCGARVTRIAVEGGRAVGVDVGGERLPADRVLLACDPKRGLLDLVDPLELPPVLERDISDVRSRGLAAKVHFAVSGPPPWDAERVVIAGGPLDVERAFDAVKYRGFADRLPLDVRVPTRSDPGLAPAGQHVVSALAHGVPFHLDGGWTDAARSRLGDAVRRTIEAVAPGFSARVVGEEVLTPADLAGRFGLPEGHLWHGELALDQLFVARPFLGSAQYRTAIEGLFLASNGAHPGAGLTGLPGWLAARSV